MLAEVGGKFLNKVDGDEWTIEEMRDGLITLSILTKLGRTTGGLSLGYRFSGGWAYDPGNELYTGDGPYIYIGKNGVKVTLGQLV